MAHDCAESGKPLDQEEDTLSGSEIEIVQTDEDVGLLSPIDKLLALHRLTGGETSSSGEEAPYGRRRGARVPDGDPGAAPCACPT